MKTPEELAVDHYYNSAINVRSDIPQHLHEDFQAEIEEAFLAGYAAANRWISVEEELPEEGQKILALEKGDPIVTWFYDKECWEDMSITHWLPIPALPEK